MKKKKRNLKVITMTLGEAFIHSRLLINFQLLYIQQKQNKNNKIYTI